MAILGSGVPAPVKTTQAGGALPTVSGAPAATPALVPAAGLFARRNAPATSAGVSAPVTTGYQGVAGTDLYHLDGIGGRTHPSTYPKNIFSYGGALIASDGAIYYSVVPASELLTWLQPGLVLPLPWVMVQYPNLTAEGYRPNSKNPF